MRIKRREVLIGVLVALVLLSALWAWAEQAEAPAIPAPVATSTPAQTEADEAIPETPTALVGNNVPTPVATTMSAAPESTAILLVDGTRYPLTAPEGATLKDAMDRLQAESTFTYTHRGYGGLGAFVTAVNNRTSTGDLVWILYVNEEKSGAGISSTRIRSGDVIEWKLEKSY